ncbi:MAG: hypothetical protein FJZ86_16180 [Chloroflexi bacterium]|nr:hypothetical protein [Chloroflexota bacterium]
MFIDFLNDVHFELAAQRFALVVMNGRGFCLGAGKTRSQRVLALEKGKMPENAADRASEPPASTVRPVRLDRPEQPHWRLVIPPS